MYLQSIQGRPKCQRKTEVPLRDAPAEESRGQVKQKGLGQRWSVRAWPANAGGEDRRRGPEAKGCGWPLEPDNDSWTTASKDMGPQSYNHMEWISANNWMGLTVDLPSELPERNISLPTPWFCLTKPGAEKESRPTQTSGQHNGEVINLCCFKQLSLW